MDIESNKDIPKSGAVHVIYSRIYDYLNLLKSKDLILFIHLEKKFNLQASYPRNRSLCTKLQRF